MYMVMVDDPIGRLLDYDRRRYWLGNGWTIRFRIKTVVGQASRPHGIKYAFTLHDEAGHRLLGFDNAHGVGRRDAFDHRHRFRRTRELVAYDYVGADELIVDFFDAVEAACRQEGVAFDIVRDDVEEDGDATEDG